MDNSKPLKLTDEQSKKTKKYSVVDGSAHNIMYGFGEQYIIPYGIRLGATSSETAILYSTPYFFGSLFQLIGAKLTNYYKDRKKIVLFFVFFQALSFIPLFLIPFFTKNILLLTFLFTIYLILGNLATPAWSSWIGEVVEEKERAKFFSYRNKVTISFLIISVLIAGLILNYFYEVNIWIGFGILFTIAMIAKLISWYYLLKHYEPKYVPSKSKEQSFYVFVKNITQGNFGNFTLFRFIFTFAVFIAAPFMPVFILSYLKLSYLQYMIIIVANMLTKVLTMKYWGRYSQKYGTRNTMFVSIFLVSIFPIGYFVASNFMLNINIAFLCLLISEMISGFGWGGFELTSFNYMLETTKKEERASFFAYFNMFWGFGLIIGGLFGAWLVKNAPKWNLSLDIILLTFLITAILRFIVALIFIPKIKEVGMKKEISESRLFFDIAIETPIEAALDNTYSAFSLAGEHFNKIHKRIKKTTKQAVSGIKNKIIKKEIIKKKIKIRR